MSNVNEGRLKRAECLSWIRITAAPLCVLGRLGFRVLHGVMVNEHTIFHDSYRASAIAWRTCTTQVDSTLWSPH